MAEINNNIPNYLLNIDREIKTKNKLPEKAREKDIDIKDKNPNTAEYIPDAGVLGRSQIKNIKGTDVSRSIDETIYLSETHPELLRASGEVFDRLYQGYLRRGVEPSEAYTKALMGEEEFLEMGKAHLQKK